MKLERLAEQHATAFKHLIDDYRKNASDTDCVTFDLFFPSALSKKTWDTKAFEALLKACDKQNMDWRPGAKDTSLTRYLLINPMGLVAGLGMMRFPLNEKTEIEGGNLVFTVPPEFREPDASLGDAMAWTINGMLFESVRAGLARALVTCPEDDPIQRRAIELNRGELENSVASPSRKGQKVARYWIRFR